MIAPYHSKTNYKSLLKFTSQMKDETTKFVFGDDYVLFIPNGNHYLMSFKDHTIEFFMNHYDKTAIPLYYEDYLQGYNRYAFCTGSRTVTIPRNMAEADRLLYTMLNKIKNFHLPWN